MRRCLGVLGLRDRSPDADESRLNSRTDGATAGGLNTIQDGSSHHSDHEGPTSLSTESREEESTRLSRRSSVLVDLLALFRRSSSFHIKAHRVRGSTEDMDEDDDEDDSHNMTKDKILEAIRYKKEIIGNLKKQPWNMKRKRRTLIVARRHLQRQEAKVSRIQLWKSELGRRFTQLSRWTNNLKIYLIPWEAKIKRIESHYGSVVSSYFTYLRWILGTNMMMSLIMALFVVIPEWLADARAPVGSLRYNKTMHFKVMPEDVRAHADELMTIWDFGGYFEYSLLFYGFYSKETYFGDTIQYRVPIAYFFVNLLILAYSFFIILRKMAANSRTSKLSSGKTEQYVFNWKSMTGWDYTIGNAETAGNVHMANVIKFREAIAEFNVKLKNKAHFLQILQRILANILILCLLAFSGWAIWWAGNIKPKDTFITQNAVPIVVSFITLIFPNIFEMIGKMEKLHPRTALRFQLVRVSALYIINFYTFFWSLFQLLEKIDADRRELRNKFDSQYNSTVPSYQNSYDVSHPRSLRQLMGLDDSFTTTPAAPPSPWTTVFSDFGPFGVQNPRAAVSNSGPLVNQNVTVFISQVIGPNLNFNFSQPIKLNFTHHSFVYAQPYRLSQYEDLCWETRIGQEITKVVTMDLLMTLFAILLIDFLRGLFIRYTNLWWCWNLEKTFPEYGEFKVAENVLHLVNNQGMIWLGLFFVPMLPFLNNIKLIILMYIRAWACMTCNVPARQIFRASRSSNFYLFLLLVMLFICTVPVGYVIASKQPSKNCGPFKGQAHFYTVILDLLSDNLPPKVVQAIEYMSSPGIIIPILLLLLLIIYFLFALVRGLKEANHDLTKQLTQERTEEKKKIFELAGGKKQRERLLERRKKNLEKRNNVNNNAIKQYSSDEDSHRISKMSSASGKPFVPSLGSVSEVDGTDGEDEFEKEEQREEMAAQYPVKLTWKQSFLVCIGLADRREYARKPIFYNPRDDDEDHEDLEAQNGDSGHSFYTPDEDEHENETDGERRNLLHPDMYVMPPNNGRIRSGGSHSASKSPKPPRSPRTSRTPALLQNQRSEEDDISGRDESFQTASRGSSRLQDPRIYNGDGSDTSSTPRSGSNRDIMTPIAEISDSYKGSPKVSPRPNTRIIENPSYFYNDRDRRSQYPGRDEEIESRSSGSSSVSQSHSLPPGVERREGLLQGPSSQRSSQSDNSYQKAAHSLLEPVLAHARTRSNDEYVPRQIDLYNVDDPSPSRERLQTPLAQLYANPHNSYTSAMMSPIMADYSLFGGVTTEDSESNDEHTHLLPMTTSSGSSGGKGRMKTSTSSGIRPPRFRISTSPPRKRLEEDSDSSARRFEMRIDEEGSHPGRRGHNGGEEGRGSRGRERSHQDQSPRLSERKSPSTGMKRNVTHTIV